VDPDRDAPSPARKGPGGRSAAARPGAARTASSVAHTRPSKSRFAPPLEVADPVVTVDSPADDVKVEVVETEEVEPEAVEAKAVKAKAVRVKPTAGVEAAGIPSTDGESADEAEPASSGTSIVKAPRLSKAVRRSARATAQPVGSAFALSVRNLTKRFGGVTAVDSVDLAIPAGTFYGFVGPNGAGKTTTLAMITGLLRPDSGVVKIHGADVWRNPAVAKKALGVLPDQLRLFDRLTGAEFLHHAGALRGLDHDTITHRVDDLATAFGLKHSLSRFVSDYSAGMVKKIAIAAAMIHSPRLLVLDEPFESVDPVSAASVIDILKKYAAAGGTVLLSSHSMGLIERTCDSVAIIADGRMLAAGPLAEVLDGASLETRFVELAGGATAVEGMEWLQSYSD
jgi:ABC-2 type transport system ATP-binding protein